MGRRAANRVPGVRSESDDAETRRHRSASTATRSRRHPIERVRILVYPGRIELTVSYGENASSAMFDFARTIAPASSSRLTIVASSRGVHPRSASDPAVVCRPAVWKLSFTMSGNAEKRTGERAGRGELPVERVGDRERLRVRQDDRVDRRPALVVCVDAREVSRPRWRDTSWSAVEARRAPEPWSPRRNGTPGAPGRRHPGDRGRDYDK